MFSQVCLMLGIASQVSYMAYGPLFGNVTSVDFIAYTDSVDLSIT